MSVTCTGKDRMIVMAISGEVDHHRAKHLMNMIDEEMERHLPRLLDLDLSGVTFMDSSGIAVVLRCLRGMKGLDGEMKVIHTPKQPLKVLQAAGLHRMMKFE